MSLLVSTAIEELNQEASNAGIRINQTNWILYLKRANNYFLHDYKMPTAQRSFDLLVYPGVVEYAGPSDLLAIMEPEKPHGLFSPNFTHQTQREFVHYPHGKLTGYKFERGTRYLLVNDDTGSSVRVHACNDTDDNGTWAVSGDGASLVQDQNIFTEGSGSLKFTVTGSGGTTTLTISDMSAINLTDIKDVGRIFLDLQCPASNTVAVSNVRLRIGSSASAYYEMSATVRFRGDTILNGWGLIELDFTSYTTTGSPDVTALNYIQIVITHGTTGINGAYRLDNIFAAEPAYYQLPYYSKNNVLDGDAVTYKQFPTDTDDTILCPDGFEEGLIYKALEIGAAEKKRDGALANYARGELNRVEKGLTSEYPNQKSRAQTTWYKKKGF